MRAHSSAQRHQKLTSTLMMMRAIIIMTSANNVKQYNKVNRPSTTSEGPQVSKHAEDPSFRHFVLVTLTRDGKSEVVCGLDTIRLYPDPVETPPFTITVPPLRGAGGS